MINNYLQRVKAVNNRQELAQTTFNFLQENHLRPLALLQLRHHPKPIRSVYPAKHKLDIERWIRQTASCPLAKGEFCHTKDFFTYWGASFEAVRYVFVLPQKEDKELLNVLTAWRQLDQGLIRLIQRVSQSESVNWANLISHLLHDINSLLSMIPRDSLNEEQANRFLYQQKVQERLLFFIRPVEVEAMPTPVSLLIEHSLKMLTTDLDYFSLIIEQDLADIKVDAELFAKGFNEIVQNSLQAVQYQKKAIEINARAILAPAIFQQSRWLEIKITDQGGGINADFLPFVKDPFFTTRKYEGYTGLGLALADKIFKTMDGHLEITSRQGQGTTATILLPYE